MLVQTLKKTLILIIVSFLFISTNSPTAHLRDFGSEFYTVGYLSKNNRTYDIYANFNASNNYKGNFYKFTQSFFNTKMSDWNCPFYYMPVASLIFNPFAYLSFSTAFMIWMGINLTILLFCLFLISKLNSESTFPWLNYLTIILLFLPILDNLFIGQVSFLFGILPLLSGFYLWLKDKNYKSALVWSLLIFKPQYLFVPAFIYTIDFLNSKQKLLVIKTTMVCLISSVLIISLNFMVFNSQVCNAWLDCLKSSIAYDISYSIFKNYHLLTSLFFSLIIEAHILKISYAFVNIVYALILAVLAVINFLVFKNFDLNTRVNKALVFTTACLSLALFSIKFFYYDFSILIFTYIILLSLKNDAKGSLDYTEILKFIMITLAIINIYIVFNIFTPRITVPIKLIVPYGILYLLFLKQIQKFKLTSR